jgi:protein TonB
VEEVAVADDDKVYKVTEIQPEYPGGMGKWNEYIKRSLKYPSDAVSKKIEGSVYVKFVIQQSGKLTDFQVIKGISPSCDKEALRLCKESIDWKPARQAGKVVKAQMVIPIKFRLADLEEKK